MSRLWSILDYFRFCYVGDIPGDSSLIFIYEGIWWSHFIRYGEHIRTSCSITLGICTCSLKRRGPMSIVDYGISVGVVASRLLARHLHPSP